MEIGLDSIQMIAIVSVLLCAISFAIGWFTKSYVWPSIWSALVIIVPGPAFLVSFIVGLLAVYVAKQRKAAATREIS
jgi:hydrogenase-4 membrane subunit HyfE